MKKLCKKIADAELKLNDKQRQHSMATTTANEQTADEKKQLFNRNNYGTETWKQQQ